MLATDWDKVLEQLDGWFDWLWRLLYPWKALQLSPSLPHHLQLCHWSAPILAHSKQLTRRHGFSFTLRVLWCVSNPGADTALMWTWEISTTGDQGPPCCPGHGQAGAKLLWWSPSQDRAPVARAVPLLQPQGEPIGSPLVPISSSPAAALALLVFPVQHWGFCGPQECGSTRATANKQQMKTSEER